MGARRRHSGATRLNSVEARRALPWFWLGSLVGVLVVAGSLGWVGKYLLEPTNLPVNTVGIESALHRVSHDAIRAIILPHADAGFLHLKVEQVRTELEALPWVYRASVRRAWPDRLLVNIQEQQAVARWAAGGLLNEMGEHFAAEDAEQWTHLPLLRGPDGTEKSVMQAFRQMQQMLRPLELAISHVSMDERRAWSMQVGEALHLGLGRTDMERRLLRFVRVYPRIVEPRLDGIESVDLRYTNGFAIRWRDGFSPPAAA
ncbi:MAG: cell division protein FtsQ/DivIB [Gammaproteobacteria bacterium]|nr:cell division protein FtsQ/DivIB [Gammaproteobacteria bacterium]